MFNLTANDLFDQDDFLRGTPESAYRMARSIIALIMRVGEVDLAVERTAGKVLSPKLMQTVRLTLIAHKGHNQRPHHRYTQPLDAAAFRAADTQGCVTLELVEP